MNTLQVKTPDGSYPIFVGAGALEHATIQGRGNCAIITNPQVGALHASRVAENLRARGFIPGVIEMPEGEQFKTLDTLRLLYDQLIDAQLDRRAMVFALGGGVVGDVAGFAAATYLRGVPLVQIPTTLLSMVDSSVGGKVAVDHPRGKNLIGAFKQPSAVIADTNVLATLPDAEWHSGLAEAIKHGIISDPVLFEKLELGNWRLEVDDWLPRAIQVKVDVVMRDPFEQGDRAKLNLGHTFGHAFETLSNYQLRHGEAVAIGTVCAARLASRLNLCDVNLIARAENVLRGVGLPTRIGHEFSVEQILAAMATDKKRVGSHLRFILPRAIGDVVIVDDVARDDVAAVIEENR